MAVAFELRVVGPCEREGRGGGGMLSCLSEYVVLVTTCLVADDIEIVWCLL